MTDTNWYWAEADGTPRATSVAALRASLSLSALPPFVLVWHTGLGDWLPAYLVSELAKSVGMDAVEQGELDPSLTEPPSAPVEWYVECFGGALPASLADTGVSQSATRDVNTGQRFDPQQMKTVLGASKPLPIGAFRSVDDYLRHIRDLRDKS